MARLLGPKDYGIIGLLAVFMELSSVFINSGFGSALIRKKNRTQEDLSTVFFFNIIVSVLCYTLLFFIAPYIADFYELPILSPVLRLIGLTLIITALNTVQVSVFNFTLNFKTQAKISIVQSIIGGITGLSLAFLGFGVWALVWQRIISSVMACIMCWTYSTWKPYFLFSHKSFKELFRYGSKLLVTGIVNTLYNGIYPIIVGKLFSPAVLGHSSRAENWASFPSTNLMTILQNVSFASLSTIQDDNERLGNVYRRMVRTSAFVIFPSMLGLSAVSEPLIYIVIGPNWGLCAQILQIICFTYMLLPINSLNNNLLLVKGRSDITMKLSITLKVIGLILLVSALPLGVLAMFYSGVVCAVIALIAYAYFIGKFINLGILKQIKDLIPIFLLSLFMFVSVKLTLYIIPNNYIKLVVGISAGVLIYIIVAYIFKFKELAELFSIYKEIKSRKYDKYK